MGNRTQIENIKITDNAVVVLFKDGTVGKELFSEYPSLANSTPQERENFTVSYFGIHWPSLDEDLSFEGFYKKNEEWLAMVDKLQNCVNPSDIDLEDERIRYILGEK